MRMGKVRLGQFALVVMLASVLSNCATKVSVEGKFAPRSGISTNGEFRRLAVMDFSGRGGDMVAAELEAVLVSAQFNDQPYFSIVDRAQTRTVMSEFARGMRGEVDASTAAKFGKQLGAQAILFGAIHSDLNSRNFDMTQEVCAAQDKKGKCVQWVKRTVHCVERKALVNVVPRLVQVESGKVVYSDQKSTTASTSFCSGESAAKGDGELLLSARSAAYKAIRRDIAPYEDIMQVKIKGDAASLEGAAEETFEGAVKFADSGRMDRACEMWRKLKNDGLVDVAIVYNLGVCAETSGELDKARALFGEADRMLSEPDDDVSEALRRVDHQIKQRRKLPGSAGS